MRTVFSWGYWGWGNHTKVLVDMVDKVEASRGFLPPLFVDIRIRRNVRAVGFNGDSFEKLLGDRYVWEKELGNESIIYGGDQIVINNPSSISTITDLVKRESNRRVIMFCACDAPVCCHRSVVADLLLDYFTTKKESVNVVEWPGGEPRELVIPIEKKDFNSILKSGGVKDIPFPFQLDACDYYDLPWYSIATIKSGSRTKKVFTGPVFIHGGRWKLGFYGFAQNLKESADVRKADGYHIKVTS